MYFVGRIHKSIHNNFSEAYYVVEASSKEAAIQLFEKESENIVAMAKKMCDWKPASARFAGCEQIPVTNVPTHIVDYLPSGRWSDF